jgi:site-specific DNA-methyltransferase (adenine-specific)
MTHMLHHGDCLDVLRTMADASVDAIVTDPPYGLSFMGKRWDYDVPSVEVWAECLRVLKPGGHLLAFAGTRTQHRMACRIEDAGFEIRDMIAWVYGSGFPKSHDISKAIDRMAGAEREVVGRYQSPENTSGNKGHTDFGTGRPGEGLSVITAPATPEAQQWAGWGTALKPALEPITMARKPLAGTVAANVLEHGTGALNVDGCRVEAPLGRPLIQPNHCPGFGDVGKSGGSKNAGATTEGRWPANLIHDGSDDVVGLFPQTAAGGHPACRNTSGYSGGLEQGATPHGAVRTDAGSASRFFKQCSYTEADLIDGNDTTVKPWNQPEHLPARDTDAPTREAEEAGPARGSSTTSSGSLPMDQSQTGCKSTTSTETKKTTDSKTSSLSPQQNTSAFIPSIFATDPEASGSASAHAASNGSLQPESTSTSANRAGCFTDAANLATLPESLPINRPGVKRLYYTAKANTAERQGTSHPTTKPLDLMAYLCRLVTPPGGTVLDPFMGSGTTIKAAIGEGFNAIGIERDPSYFAMAEHRMNGAQLGLSLRRYLPLNQPG